MPSINDNNKPIPLIKTPESLEELYAFIDTYPNSSQADIYIVLAMYSQYIDNKYVLKLKEG